MASSLRFNRAVLEHIKRRLASRRRVTLPGKPPRKAAVMLPLCNVNGAASCLFTKRTEEVGTHKGQVSFPGGHVDVGETSIEAAQRELVEELGSAAGRTTVLGKHDQALASTCCARWQAVALCASASLLCACHVCTDTCVPGFPVPATPPQSPVHMSRPLLAFWAVTRLTCPFSS